jgi:nucleoside-diphosphate-sugar epimerase
MSQLPRVIVTGGSGFLGRRLVGALLGRARVVGIDRRPRAEAYVPDHENMSWHQIDLGDAAAVEETFAEIRAAGRVDAFIHLAAYYDFTGEEDPEYQRTNVAGLGHVLDACRTLGLRRFVFASSAGAVRVRRDRAPLNEDVPADGEHVYAKTKRIGEAMVRERSRDFPTVAVRLGALFSDWCEFPPLYSFLETWLSRAWNARVLGGRGETSTPYLHVRDAVSFFLRLLEHVDTLEGSPTLLASADGSVSHRELFEAATAYVAGRARSPILVPAALAGPGMALNDLIGRMRGERPFERPWMARYIDTHLHVDASRTRRILGWEPHPRLGLLSRVPYMIENKRSDPVEWKRRNAEALEHHQVRPNYVVFRIVRRHAEEIAAAHFACFHGPGADPALARYREMKVEERQYHTGLLIRNLMEAVRTGTKGGFMAFCRNLAEHRHRQGFRVEELLASLQALRRVSLEIVGRDPEAERYRRPIRDYLEMTIEFGMDQIQEVFEEHETGAIADPEGQG